MLAWFVLVNEHFHNHSPIALVIMKIPQVILEQDRQRRRIWAHETRNQLS